MRHGVGDSLLAIRSSHPKLLIMIRTKYLSFIVILIAVYACTRTVTQDAVNKSTAYTPDTANCAAPSTWFTIVNGTRRTPAPNEGPTSVFANNETVTNCDFHQWSWQKFLWLTNNING